MGGGVEESFAYTQLNTVGRWDDHGTIYFNAKDAEWNWLSAHFRVDMVTDGKWFASAHDRYRCVEASHMASSDGSSSASFSRRDAMRDAFEAKFSDPRLAEMLLATGDRHLVEVERCDFWGAQKDAVGSYRGRNATGRILMELRAKLRNESGA